MQHRWRGRAGASALGVGSSKTARPGLLDRLVVRGFGLLGALWLVACGAAPQSQFPSAKDALEQMRETVSCSRGVQGEAALDYYGDEGRVTGTVLYYAMLPEQLRFDVVSPFGMTVSTLTADGTDFALYDLQNKRFLYGPANACNVARFTRVPVPPFVLAQLLHGEAPVLVHEPAQASIEWDSGFFSGGHYIVKVRGKHEAFEEIQLTPVPQDFDKHWRQQRLRVLSVRVDKRTVPLYEATLRGHHQVFTKPIQPDPDGLAAPLQPSGPKCNAEVPRSVRIEVPSSGQDVVFRHSEQWHNPALPPNVFEQSCPPGMSCQFSNCADAM